MNHSMLCIIVSPIFFCHKEKTKRNKVVEECEIEDERESDKKGIQLWYSLNSNACRGRAAFLLTPFIYRTSIAFNIIADWQRYLVIALKTSMHNIKCDAIYVQYIFNVGTEKFCWSNNKKGTKTCDYALSMARTNFHTQNKHIKNIQQFKLSVITFS